MTKRNILTMVTIEYREVLKRAFLISILVHIAILYLMLPAETSHLEFQRRDSSGIVMQTYIPKPPPTPPPQKRTVRRRHSSNPVPVPGTISAPEPLPEPVIPEPPSSSDNFFIDDPFVPEPEPPNNRVFNPGDGVRLPEIIYRVQPEYPDVARKLGIQGLVVIQAVISEDGLIEQAEVIRSLNSVCDRAALAAIRQWRFKPGTYNDTPVRVRMSLTVIFKLGR